MEVALTVAVCMKCGAKKHGAWTPCRKCRHSPFGEHELAWSVVLSDHSLPRDELDRASQFIARTGKLPDVEDSILNKQMRSIQASSRSLAKRGLLPDREPQTDKKFLMVASVADTKDARFWRSIRLFDIRLYHPEASVPIAIAGGTFQEPMVVFLSAGFAGSLDCLRFLAEAVGAGYDPCCVALDDTDPQDIGLDSGRQPMFDVRSEDGRKRFLDWLKAVE